MSNHRYGLRTASGNIKDILQEDSLQVGRVLRSRTRINQGDVFFSDLFGMPLVGYSLRKLTPNAINCIRVRRSNDNAEQDIGFINNKPNAPINTGQLLQFVGANDGFVTTWYNQNTTSINAIQTTGANQPQIVDSGAMININSLPSIKFDGSNDSLNATSLNVTNIAQTTAEVVMKLNSTSPNNVTLTISEAFNGQIYLQYTESNLFRNFYRNTATNTTPTLNQAIISFYSDAINAIFYQDTTQIASYAAGAAAAGANGISIGRWSGGSFFSDVNMQEIIIWDGAKSSDRADIQTNIDDYYNVL
jgi:hypothetical protein